MAASPPPFAAARKKGGAPRNDKGCEGLRRSFCDCDPVILFSSYMKKSLLIAAAGLGFVIVVASVLHVSLAKKFAAERDAISATIGRTNPPELSASRIDPPALTAAAYLSAVILPDGRLQILIEKNMGERLRIASITKLVTAIVAVKNYRAEESIAIPVEALTDRENAGKLKASEAFFFKEILYPLLIESDNGAARALALRMGDEQTFVGLMNQEARALGLVDTHFVNSTGLDPDQNAEGNYSTASDVAKLISAIARSYPDIFGVMGIQEHDLYANSGVFHHHMKNTNRLLGEQTALKILAGKTGETPMAKKNLVVVTDSPAAGEYMAHAVLNSNDNFEDMKKLLEWAREAGYDY